MKNNKLVIFNILIVCILFAVIYIGNNTWGTKHETKGATQVAGETLNPEQKTHQKDAVEIIKNPQLIHKPFKRKQKSDFDLFNRDALDIVEIEEDDEEEEMNEDDVTEDDWEEPSENVNYSGYGSDDRTSTGKQSISGQTNKNNSSSNKVNSDNKKPNKDKGESERPEKPDKTEEPEEEEPEKPDEQEEPGKPVKPEEPQEPNEPEKEETEDDSNKKNNTKNKQTQE